MRHASGNLHTSYNDMQHHTAPAAAAAAAAASTTTSGHSATRATAERAPPAGDENNRQPQLFTNSRATEYRELSCSYTSRFIVSINNRLYFEDNVT